MAHQFRTHYTLDEARALLPQIRVWLDRIVQLRRSLQECEERLSGPLAAGADCGGDTVNCWVAALAGLKATLLEFQEREIQLKDLDRGLVDFPSLRGDREVFLCWEKDEDDIEFWHDIGTGYSGRERLEPQ